MRRRGSLFLGIAVVTLGALALDSWFFAPKRVEQSLDALPRLTLAQVAEPLETLDTIVFLDDRDGWFLIDTPDRAAALELAARGLRPDAGGATGTHVPQYCGADRGRILWGIRAARIVTELAYCDPEGLDLRALRTQGAPIRMERDFLTPAQVEVLAAEVAQDPRRIAVTLPGTMVDLPFERIVALPWIWSQGDAGHSTEEALGRGADLIDAALRAGGVDPMDFAIAPAPRRAAEAAQGGVAAPVLTVDGQPAVVPGLGPVMQPVYLVRCRQAACDALDAFDPGAALADWRDRAVLDAALSRALPVPDSPVAGLPPNRAALVSEETAVGATTPLRYAVRIARRLNDAP